MRLVHAAFGLTDAALSARLIIVTKVKLTSSIRNV